MATATINWIGLVSSTAYRIQYRVVLTDLEAADDLPTPANTAVDAALAAAPGSVVVNDAASNSITLWRDGYSVDIDSNCDFYIVSVDYVLKSAPSGTEVGGWVFPEGEDTILQLNIGATTVRKNVALEEIATAGSPTGAPLLVPDGYDAVTAETTFTVRKRYTTVPSGWGTTIADKIGSTNNAILFGAPIDTLLYKGCTSDAFPVTGQSGVNIVLTHTYAYAPAEASIVIDNGAALGGSVTIPAKSSGHYLTSVVYHTGRNRATWQDVRVAVGVRILRVYPSANISPI